MAELKYNFGQFFRKMFFNMVNEVYCSFVFLFCSLSDYASKYPSKRFVQLYYMYKDSSFNFLEKAIDYL